MLHPFEPFKPIYVSKLLELKKYYLVSQTYERFTNYSGQGAKVSLLLTDYADINLARAHVAALRGDKYAALLDLQRPAHKAKVLELIGADSHFNVFWAVVHSAKALEDKLKRVYKESIRRYISRHTSWRISRDATLRPSLELVNGELYVTLTHSGHTIRVKFEEIETV